MERRLNWHAHHRRRHERNERHRLHVQPSSAIRRELLGDGPKTRLEIWSPSLWGEIGWSWCALQLRWMERVLWDWSWNGEVLQHPQTVARFRFEWWVYQILVSRAGGASFKAHSYSMDHSSSGENSICQSPNLSCSNSGFKIHKRRNFPKTKIGKRFGIHKVIERWQRWKLEEE